MKQPRVLFQRYSILGIFVILFLGFFFFVPSFSGRDNITNLLVQSSLLGVLAFGLNIVMMAGEIDISFAGSVPLLASIFVIMVQKYSPWLAFLTLCGVALLIGLINVGLVSILKLNSFVATVSVMFLLTGTWYAFTGGTTIWLGDRFKNGLLNNSIGPIPLVGCIMLVLAVILYIVSEHTSFAMAMRAVRTDKEAARSSGISVGKTKMVAFLGAGLVFALGSVLSVARLSGAMATAGTDIMLPTMTIAFVGQSVLGFGRPNILGILLGTVLLAMINNAFVLMRMPFWSVPIAYGLILLTSIALSNLGRTEIIQVKM
jgi:ribose transport system permease protein